MIRIAIVEDEEEELKQLMSYIELYQKEYEVPCRVHTFSNGVNFLSDYQGDYDVIFLDIVMPHMLGIDVAEKLRKIDRTTSLIFITKMAKFAIEGYKFNALDYLIKPVKYIDVVYELNQVKKGIERNKNNAFLYDYNGLIALIPFDEIIYVDILDHQVCIHTERKIYAFRGTLKDVQGKLTTDYFGRCNNCYLVNFSHIKEIENDNILLSNGEMLRISRPRKKEFMDLFSSFLGDLSLK